MQLQNFGFVIHALLNLFSVGWGGKINFLPKAEYM